VGNSLGFRLHVDARTRDVTVTVTGSSRQRVISGEPVQNIQFCITASGCRRPLPRRAERRIRRGGISALGYVRDRRGLK
jgi:hypothetical protein